MVISSKAGVPKRDGSGKGQQANRGRGGCATPRRSTRVGRANRRQRIGRGGNR